MSEESMALLMKQVVKIGKLAAKEIMDVYLNRDDYGVQVKADDSPITIADRKSHQLIESELKQLIPDWPILSEEGTEISYEERQSWHRYWLIDPLDGTKEFIAGSGEFTVNIALIENNEPIMGVVMVPALDECYFALKNGQAYWQKEAREAEVIAIQPRASDTPLRVTVSRRHGSPEKLEQFLKKVNVPHKLVNYGSTLKICLIAKGEADIYPRFGKTSEWDTAAGQCVLEAAGGQVLALPECTRLQYNLKPSLLNPEFLAFGHFDLKPTMLE